MSDRSGSLVLMACAALTLACRGDGGTGPDAGAEPVPITRDTVPPPVLGGLWLSPTRHLMPQGSTLQLDVRASSKQGRPMVLPRPIVFESDAPSIAKVDSAGVVTALAPGAALISARASSGGSTLTTGMTLYVVDTLVRDSVFLIMGQRGWEPNPVSVAVGGTVRWSAYGAWWATGTKVYLLWPDYHVRDSVAVKDGVATYTFTVADTVAYCSGGCWDPHEFGLIIVR